MRGQWQSQTRRLNRHYQSGGGGDKYESFITANASSTDSVAFFPVYDNSKQLEVKSRKIKLSVEIDNSQGYNIVLRQATLQLTGINSTSRKYQWMFTNGIDYPNDPRPTSDQIIQLDNVETVVAHFPYGVDNTYYGERLNVELIINEADALTALQGETMARCEAYIWLGIGGTSDQYGDFDRWSVKVDISVTR